MLVRNPQQRAYSHWKMGLEWMSSKCTKESELATLSRIMPLITFDALMERSLLQVNWNACHKSGRASTASPNGFKAMALSPREAANVKEHHRGVTAGGSGSDTYECLLQRDAELTARFYDELVGDWPPNEDDKRQLTDAIQLLGHCSEQMLTPPGALVKGSMYVDELTKWTQVGAKCQVLSAKC